MKFYYAIAILVQMLLAFLSGDRNKMSYMLYLWGNLLGCVITDGKKNKNSDSDPRIRKSNPEIGNDKYYFIIER